MRVDWVDNAKALGILAIVAGHAPGLDMLLRDFLYTFHVPLFFFLSGFLLKPAHVARSWREYVLRNAQRLLIPYVFFWAVSFLLWFAFQTVAGKMPTQNPEGILTQFQGLLLGTSVSLLDVNGVLWFYTSLFTVAILFYFVARLPQYKTLLVAVAACGALGWLTHVALGGARLPWNLDLVFVAMFFYGMGYASQLGNWPARLPSGAASLGLAAVSLGVTLGATLLNGKVDMSWQHYGPNYLVYVVGALAGILMVVALGRGMPGSGVARYLSENTLTIFSLHFPMFFAFWGIGHYILKLPENFDKNSMPMAAIYVLGAMLLCVVAVWVLKRYLPWVLGIKPITKT